MSKKQEVTIEIHCGEPPKDGVRYMAITDWGSKTQTVQWCSGTEVWIWLNYASLNRSILAWHECVRIEEPPAPRNAFIWAKWDGDGYWRIARRRVESDGWSVIDPWGDFKERPEPPDEWREIKMPEDDDA